MKVIPDHCHQTVLGASKLPCHHQPPAQNQLLNHLLQRIPLRLLTFQYMQLLKLSQREVNTATKRRSFNLNHCLSSILSNWLLLQHATVLLLL
jgi:predicted transcriptional regulator